ncbi:hypothetical protein QEZ54_18210 [Catellatospora sp. KI3]|uniref:hypothetical protein n=1 Tax=Catellatospora sp. KI3 TaxID=3041620 RepID=UPI002482ECAE|nr:hypothetical protein [Catellatospora sp. KI3]MDI1462914.1 hypothetical protein [Catellatospora sp. KI3]
MKASPLAAAVVAAGALVVPAAPAAATAEQPVVLAQRTSPVDAAAKSVTVQCPPGSWVFTVGAQVVGGGGRVQLVRMEPAADLRSVVVAARPRSDAAGAFSLVAEAVCGRSERPPTLVTASSTQASAVALLCPGQTDLLGFGFRLERPVDQWRIDALVPNQDLTGVQVHAAGGGQQGALAVAAICYRVDPQSPSVRPYRWQGVSTPGSPWPKSAGVEPTGDDWSFGVGGLAVGVDAHLDAFVPRPTGTSWVRAQSVAASLPPGAARSVAPAAADNGSVTAYAARIGTFH